VRYLRVSIGAGLLAAAVIAIAAVAGSSQGGAAVPSSGPEGISLVRARPLAAPASPLPGQTIDGIGCGSTEQLAYHVHARLTIYDHGRARSVPGGIGINPPLKVVPTAAGSFVAGGTCFSLLHTHAADGVIHVESPHAITFVLAQFFAVWHQPLDTTHVGPATGRVTAFVDGRLYPGDPGAIPLAPHTQIQLDVGGPVIRPRLIRFPGSL
jgi:hypothetical protein